MGELQFLKTRVAREEGAWVVSVPRVGGGAIEYLCRTRRKARYMASIFRLAPSWIPPPHRTTDPHDLHDPRRPGPGTAGTRRLTSAADAP